MKRKPVLLRAVARQDIEQALAYYLNEATPRTALGFITDAERAKALMFSSCSSNGPSFWS
jgi:hypothetical protein